MPAGSNKNVAFIAVIAVMVPILIGVWFALPMFLPMYLWTKVDLPKLSRQTGVSQDRLATKFNLTMRYNPRADGDPLPWQIIAMDPPWDTVHPNAESEESLLVRCTFVCANDGEPPGTTFINNTFKDRYYKTVGLRLPPGSLGFAAKRPVVIYNRLDLARLTINEADLTQRQISTWENDDEWEDRDDGWSRPSGAP